MPFGSGFNMPRSKRGPYRKRMMKPKVGKAVKKYVAKAIKKNEEPMYIDTTVFYPVGSVQTNNLGSITPLSLVAQGDDITQRAGDIIKPIKLNLKFDVQSFVDIVGTAPSVTYLRTIVFQDTIANGVLPLVADVLQALFFNSDINDIALQAKRYHIVFDKIWQLDQIVSGSLAAATVVPPVYTSKSYQQRIFNRKMRGKIDYLSPAGTIAAQGRHGLFLLLLSDKVTARSPQTSLQFRVTYIE